MMSLGSTNTAMTDHLLVQCSKYAAVKEYADQATIHNRGEVKLGLSVIYSGQVKIGNYGIDGSYQHSVTLLKGDTFGEFTLFNNLPRTHHAMALGECKLIQMTENQFDKCTQDTPELSKFLLRSMSLKLHMALEKLDDIQRLPTFIRLAKLLLQYADPHGIVKLSQKDIAEQLGVTVLSSHKAIKKLAGLLLIKSSYGAIVINHSAQFKKWVQQQMSLGQIAEPD
ncbi:MAG: CRP/FNR family cyclic AMP-dependent transcriptional regulator [Psychrobacter glaciei]|jgi:CRP/FNR family cyclic AMP-dependent transcriptional regulator